MSVLLKRLLTALGITIVLVGGYLLWMQQTSTVPDLGTDEVMYQQNRSQEVLEYRLQIDDIDLDTDIFNDPRFTSLKDIQVEIRDVNTGRTNPFADTR